MQIKARRVRVVGMSGSNKSDWPGFLIETEVPGAIFIGMDDRGVRVFDSSPANVMYARIF